MKYLYQEALVCLAVLLVVSAAVAVSYSYGVINVYPGAWF